MERAFKLLLPLLILVEIGLVWTGLLNLSTAIGVVVAVEAAVMAVSARQALAVVRRYRRERRSGGDVWSALENALAVVLPRKVARLLSLEPKLWLCLWLWISRRGSQGEAAFAYRKRSIVGALLLVVFLTTPVELLLFELIIPWSWLRSIVLVGAIYLLIWSVGLYASLIVLPHRLEAEGIHLFYGTLAEVYVPYTQIACAVAQRSWVRRGDGLRTDHSSSAAYFVVGGQTDVTIELATECVVHGLLGPTKPIGILHVAVDDPHRLVSRLQRLIGEAAGNLPNGSTDAASFDRSPPFG